MGYLYLFDFDQENGLAYITEPSGLARCRMCRVGQTSSHSVPVQIDDGRQFHQSAMRRRMQPVRPVRQLRSSVRTDSGRVVYGTAVHGPMGWCRSVTAALRPGDGRRRLLGCAAPTTAGA